MNPRRLVLLGEGHGELSALPNLTSRLLHEKGCDEYLFVDQEVVRAANPAGLITWNRRKQEADFAKWHHHLKVAQRRRGLGAVLAVFDGDARCFPAGSSRVFCVETAARCMAKSAEAVGAGKVFSLAVVFACVEYEGWIIASTESLAGKRYQDGRPILPASMKFPSGNPESHGKKWLEKHLPDYRPRRDQRPLTELMDFRLIRAKNLRSFKRLEHAIDQIADATKSESFISTPE